MARCPDCNKFVSLDSEQDPEVSIDVDENGHVTGTVEIANACENCGTEITRASFDVDVDAADLKDENGKTLADFLAALTPDGHERASFEVEETSTERTSRTEGKGRGTKTFYGSRIEFDVKVEIEGDPEKGTISYDRTFSGSHEDEVQASAMDEA